jgi:anti-sigma regulatory factor (Ser/Thr protein kinase)
MATAPAAPPFRLDMQRELAALDRLAPFLREVAEASGLEADQMFAPELCCEEAIVNIIKHGAVDGGAEAMIAVSVVQTAPLVIVIEDGGHPFDPTTAPPPKAAASLAEAEIGGLGIHLIRRMTKAMRYERVNGRNRLILTFN